MAHAKISLRKMFASPGYSQGEVSQNGPGSRPRNAHETREPKRNGRRQDSAQVLEIARRRLFGDRLHREGREFESLAAYQPFARRTAKPSFRSHEKSSAQADVGYVHSNGAALLRPCNPGGESKAAKDDKLSSQDDYAGSERATNICWCAWLSHSRDPAKRARAKLMREAASSMSAGMEPKERASFTSSNLSEPAKSSSD
jgi:hypothetical protein